MASPSDKENLIKSTFRRDSLKDSGVEVIEVDKLPTILGLMGQQFDQEQLDLAVQTIDPLRTGKLDENAYTQVMTQFIRDPAALLKFHGDDFAFKHLINLTDFASP